MKRGRQVSFHTRLRIAINEHPFCAMLAVLKFIYEPAEQRHRTVFTPSDRGTVTTLYVTDASGGRLIMALHMLLGKHLRQCTC